MTSADALVIPLGKAAQQAVTLLIADGFLDESKCLTGFPQPSGGKGHRVKTYAANREKLTSVVASWAVADA